MFQLKDEELKQKRELNCKMFQEVQELKQQLAKGMDEQFFKSKVFCSLVGQGQELLKYLHTLKQQLAQANAKISEVEKLRQKEVTELIAREQEERERL